MLSSRSSTKDGGDTSTYSVSHNAIVTGIVVGSGRSRAGGGDGGGVGVTIAERGVLTRVDSDRLEGLSDEEGVDDGVLGGEG